MRLAFGFLLGACIFSANVGFVPWAHAADVGRAELLGNVFGCDSADNLRVLADARRKNAEAVAEQYRALFERRDEKRQPTCLLRHVGAITYDQWADFGSLYDGDAKCTRYFRAYHRTDDPLAKPWVMDISCGAQTPA